MMRVRIQTANLILHDRTQEITGRLHKSIGYPKEIIDLTLYGRISDDLLKGAAKKYAPSLRDALKKEIVRGE